MTPAPLLALNWTWALDGWIVAAAVLCAVASSPLGVFLVLRRQSMLGDAVTHAILPGLAVAFLLSGSRSGVPMFVGAVVVGVFTALFTEWIRRYGRVDEGASMGVVFTSLFALGLLLIVRAADEVHLDPDCVLYGAIELTPLDTVPVAGFEIPRAVLMLGAVAAINLLFVSLFYKELKIGTFDPALATSVGLSATAIHYLLMTLVAVTAVASFESVGSILVVATFVVPAAAAHMLTDRLGPMLWLATAIGVVAAVAGHLSALVLPTWFGFRSTTTASMIAVCAGFLFLLAVTLAPRHGLLVRFLRQRSLSFSILKDDVLAWLYRREERDRDAVTPVETIATAVVASAGKTRSAVRSLARDGLVGLVDDGVTLTAAGHARGGELIRSHRLWEEYLVTVAGTEPTRSHGTAHTLEHLTDRDLRARLATETDDPVRDPHGREIPQEEPPT